jgi:hypothetical protein
MRRPESGEPCGQAPARLALKGLVGQRQQTGAELHLEGAVERYS